MVEPMKRNRQSVPTRLNGGRGVGEAIPPLQSATIKGGVFSVVTRLGARQLAEQGPWLLLAALATLCVILTIDPAGSYPQWWEGPGLTLDESFNLQQGVYLVEVVRTYGIALLDPVSIQETFGSRDYLADHPPLGRCWLGLHHQFFRWAFPPTNPEGLFVTACGRTGAATAYGLTIWLLGAFAARRWGAVAGLTTALAYALSPRIFAHAHLASLESTTNLAWTIVLINWVGLRSPIATPLSPASNSLHTATPSVDQGMTPPSRWRLFVAGTLWAVLILTKVQGVLLAPVLLVTIWPMGTWSFRTIGAGLTRGVVIGLIAVGMMVVLWPYLWLDPWDHLVEFVHRATKRAELSTWYLGQVWGDRQVPRTMPLLVFLVTTPALVWLSAVAGWCWPATRRLLWGERHALVVIAAAAIAPLVIFSLPRVALYDMERLFLVAQPGWCLLAGASSGALAHNFAGGTMLVGKRLLLGCAVTAGVWLTVLIPAHMQLHPLQLSYFNPLIGGVSGAERAGLEVTYWGDSLTRSFLQRCTQRIPPGSQVAVAPVLHQFYVGELGVQSPLIRAAGWRLTDDRHTAPYLLAFWRRADLRPQPGPDWELLEQESRSGVLLAGLYQRRTPIGELASGDTPVGETAVRTVPAEAELPAGSELPAGTVAPAGTSSGSGSP